MPLNPPMMSVARQPRGIVVVQGHKSDGSLDSVTRLDAWISFEVNNNTYYEADTFRVVFALSALPKEYNDLWWASQQEIFVEVFAGFPMDAENYSQSELQSLTYGRVDDIDYDPVARTITVTGRDLTATMIDAKTTESFQNQTASQVATTIAARHGLTPVVTATKTLTGKYYEIDTLRVNQQRSEWDILTALAGEEQMIVYVRGHELHFEPAPAVDSTAYLLLWEPPSEDSGAFNFNGKRISFTRALNLARGVVVTVISRNQRGQKISATYPNKQSTIKPGQSKPQAQQYTFTYAHLTQQQALNIAQQKHSEISKHEVKLSACLPADNILLTTNLIKVEGTATAFDQTYYPESITRRMDISTGYEMEIRAKNHSPLSVVPL